VKSNFPLSFFQSSFYIFLEFWIFEKCKRRKIKYAMEKEKNKMADFLRGGKLKMVEERRKNQI
jgi:hypothetical protein